MHNRQLRPPHACCRKLQRVVHQALQQQQSVHSNMLMQCTDIYSLGWTAHVHSVRGYSFANHVLYRPIIVLSPTYGHEQGVKFSPQQQK